MQAGEGLTQRLWVGDLGVEVAQLGGEEVGDVPVRRVAAVT